MTDARLGLTVAVEGLTIVAGQRTLLAGATARFEPGEVTLIIGVSGAGKSTLLRALAGLLDPHDAGLQVTGRIRLGEKEFASTHARRGVGVVFQEPALFDELSPLDNVRLALAHRRRSREKANSLPGAEALLYELQVPADVRTSALSGGQRQRLAIARTLASDPDVILYDEPTGGLDAVTAGQVAALIQATHLSHPKTSIVVTHDYAALAPIADRIYLLDPDTRSLREIDRADWPRLREYLQPIAVAEPPEAAETYGRTRKATPRRLVDRLRRSGTAGGDFFACTANVAEVAAAAPAALVPLWKSLRWGLRFLLHYLWLVAGPSAWIYLAISGMIVGFVTTHFTFRYLPFPQYTQPLLIEDLLMAVGFALYRILVPVLATILIAARCGAAVASDVGGKQYGHQIDALRTLGVRPRSYLLTPILYSLLLGTPLLTVVAYATASWTSVVVFSAAHPTEGPNFWDLYFHRKLVTPEAICFRGTGWLLAKTLLCALGIGLIAYHQGVRPKYSPRAVSRGITATILWATLYVLLVHFAFAFFEFERDRSDVRPGAQPVGWSAADQGNAHGLPRGV